jgi:hypothetical protein
VALETEGELAAVAADSAAEAVGWAVVDSAALGSGAVDSAALGSEAVDSAAAGEAPAAVGAEA